MSIIMAHHPGDGIRQARRKLELGTTQLAWRCGVGRRALLLRQSPLNNTAWNTVVATFDVMDFDVQVKADQWVGDPRAVVAAANRRAGMTLTAPPAHRGWASIVSVLTELGCTEIAIIATRRTG